MSNSKRETELVLKLLSGFVTNLTNEQFEKLVSGEAEIRIVDRKIDSDTIQMYKSILKDMVSREDIESRREVLITNINKKTELINMSKYLNINIKSRETVHNLIESIVSYTFENQFNIISNNENEQEYEEQVSDLLNRIQEMMDTNEAKTLLKNSPVSRRKTDLLNFAKKMSVFPDRRLSTEDIINEIVKSVVEAKLRSYKIRKKI